jgi:hypothetical protein
VGVSDFADASGCAGLVWSLGFGFWPMYVDLTTGTSLRLISTIMSLVHAMRQLTLDSGYSLKGVPNVYTGVVTFQRMLLTRLLRNWH